MDILTRAFQETGDQAGDLLDTYSEYSVQFAKLGLDGKEATGLLIQGLKAGARDVDTVADSIKEFSIRAIDGSESSADGFKALGLNAKTMTAQIASGGAGAQKGLDVVLDRLRAMKDPVERDAAAVALFGTKAEDMGQALWRWTLTPPPLGSGTSPGPPTRWVTPWRSRPARSWRPSSGPRRPPWWSRSRRPSRTWRDGPVAG
ncbi:phage tail tape measure protein [Micromonospora sp. M12]